MRENARKLGERNWRKAARMGTAGGSYKRRPWLTVGCCANDDDGSLGGIYGGQSGNGSRFI